MDEKTEVNADALGERSAYLRGGSERAEDLGRATGGSETSDAERLEVLRGHLSENRKYQAFADFLQVADSLSDQQWEIQNLFGDVFKKRVVFIKSDLPGSERRRGFYTPLSVGLSMKSTSAIPLRGNQRPSWRRSAIVWALSIKASPRRRMPRKIGPNRANEEIARLAQIPYSGDGRQGGMVVEWERSEGFRQSPKNPGPTPAPDTISGSRTQEFQLPSHKKNIPPGDDGVNILPRASLGSPERSAPTESGVSPNGNESIARKIKYLDF